MFSWIGTIGSIWTVVQQILVAVKKLGESLVTAQQALEKLTADVTAMVTRVNADFDALRGQVGTLQTQVQTLQDQLASGDISPDAQAAFDALDATITGLDVPSSITPPAAARITG